MSPADGWIPSFGHAPPEAVPAMRDKIFTAAAKAGREPDEITCAYHLQLRMDAGAVTEPGIVAGTPERIADQLVAFTELGFTALSITPVGRDRTTEVERLAAEVIPAVRAQL